MEYSMYTCPECRKVFKVKGNGKKVKCTRCENIYLLDLEVDAEVWSTYSKASKDSIISEAIDGEEIIEVEENEPVEIQNKQSGSSYDSFFADDDFLGEQKEEYLSSDSQLEIKNEDRTDNNQVNQYGQGSFFGNDNVNAPINTQASVNTMSNSNSLSKKSSSKRGLSVVAGIIGCLLFVAAIAVVLYLFVFSKKPESTVEAFCKALIASDEETMSSLMAEGNSFYESTNDSDELNTFVEYIKELNQNIKYEIIESTTDGNKATVTVAFVYPDAREIIGAVFVEYLGKAFELAFSGQDASSIDENQLLLDILNEKKSTMTPGEAEAKVTVECIKDDGKWLISEFSDEIADVASGNLVTALEELSDSFNNSSSLDDADSTEVSSASTELEMGEQYEVAINEEVELETIKMVVNNCYETKTLNSYFDEIIEAQGGTKFVIFEVKIENISKEAFEFDSTGIPLLDSQERYFNQDTDTTFDVDNYIAYRELNPNIPETGIVIYKVPEDASDYRMVVGKDGTNEYYLFNGN